jgi:hypothetical protein
MLHSLSVRQPENSQHQARCRGGILSSPLHLLLQFQVDAISLVSFFPRMLMTSAENSRQPQTNKICANLVYDASPNRQKFLLSHSAMCVGLIFLGQNVPNTVILRCHEDRSDARIQKVHKTFLGKWAHSLLQWRIC